MNCERWTFNHYLYDPVRPNSPRFAIIHPSLFPERTGILYWLIIIPLTRSSTVGIPACRQVLLTHSIPPINGGATLILPDE
jgi:hypothetical protein